MNTLTLYGGIDEKFIFLNDVHVLRLDNLCWCNVEIGGIPKQPRAGHGAAFSEKKMIVFGGYNKDGFLSGEV